jgi:hypothetical protein
LGRPPHPLIAGLLALAAWPAAAQLLLNPALPNDRRLIAGFERYWDAAGAEELDCRIEVFPPRLSYDLRAWTGFEVELPARQFAPSGGETLLTLVRVRPENGETAYLWRRDQVGKLNDDPKFIARAIAEFGSGLYLGPGKYRVEAVVADARDRVCRKAWDLNTKQGEGIPRGHVEALSFRPWRGASPRNAEAGGHAAILLHAQPVRPRRAVVKLTAFDRMVLSGVVRAVVEQGPFASASVTVFDLDRKRVLYETPALDRRTFRAMERALEAAEFASISLENYKSLPDPWPFLSGLLTKAAAQSPAPRSLVFVGSGLGWSPRAAEEQLAPLRSLPPLSAIALLPQQTSANDTLSHLARKLGGKVYSVYEAKNVRKAVQSLR